MKSYEVRPISKIGMDRDKRIEHLKGEIIQNSSVEAPIQIIVSLRVEKIFLLFDKKLLLQFCYYPCFAVYSFDIKNKIFSFNYVISCGNIRENAVQLNHSTLLLITDYYIEQIVIKEKTYERTILHLWNCLFCIGLKNQRLLFLAKNGLVYFDQKQSKDYQVSMTEYYNFTFGFKLSNDLILINKEKIVLIESLEYFERKKTFASFSNEIFNAIKCCSENIQKKKLYCQTGKNIIIINTQTFQIESIYKTFHFSFIHYLIVMTI